MKRTAIYILLAFIVLTLQSCERVAPNYAGVLMENFGKEGKKDFTIVSGRVSTFEVGTELFQVPLFEQRGGFTKPFKLKSSDQTEFMVQPTYSYRVIKDRAIDIVFDNKHIENAETDNGKDGFMQSLEDNILEPRIFDLIKEECRKYTTDSLMANGGILLFEKNLEVIVEEEFKNRGLQLVTFSAQVDPTEAVKKKIDSRNEVNTNLSVLDQQIEEQKKRNELERLKTEQALIRSKGLTKEVLYEAFIDKWDGKTPLYGVTPEFLRLTGK